MSSKITAEHLCRKAVIYVRQSTTTQVVSNQESQRRQYGLQDTARAIGFTRIEIIDEDLGRSGSGTVERPGFQRLVAAVCAGEIGAIFCLEASRLARNGRDWHHLIDLCALVGTLVIDPDGSYDPRLVNDRLLLGMKGTMSEFELSLLRQRSLEAITMKAKRGALQYGLPVGLCWTNDGRVELEPDQRVQQAIGLVFQKFKELGSARQVLLWFRAEKIELPSVQYGESGKGVRWRLPVYHSILSFLQSPLYAGAYVFGRHETKTDVVDGRARKTAGHRKPRERWTVLIPEHHPGYISWEQFEHNKTMLEQNAHGRKAEGRKAGRGGRALLCGLLRCARCGRMLHVGYVGDGGMRYYCRGAQINHGTGRCISFGGLRLDQAIADELLHALDTTAIDAAIQAAELVEKKSADRRKAMEMELEQARYETRLAARRYEAVDPDQRLVAAELEARWNTTLERVQMLESKLAEVSIPNATHPPVDRERLLALAGDLSVVWHAPSAAMHLKQRIVRLLIEEVVADVDDTRAELMLTIHWAGGRHSELRTPKNKAGRHGRCTDLQAVDVVRRMAGRWSDEQIAATLNRLNLRTGADNSWTKARVASLRSYHQLPALDKERRNDASLTLEQAAERLEVSPSVVRRLIQNKVLPASQVVMWAPWEIAPEALELPAVQAAITQVKAGQKRPRTASDPRQLPIILDR